MINDQEQIYEIITKIVHSTISNLGLLKGDWQLGTIDSIISPKKAMVFINGSSESYPIPTNPDVTFHPQDSVFVILVNGDSKNKFVISRRAV